MKNKDKFNPEEVEIYINKFSTINNPHPKIDLDFKVSSEDMEKMRELKDRILKTLEEGVVEYEK